MTAPAAMRRSAYFRARDALAGTREPAKAALAVMAAADEAWAALRPSVERAGYGGSQRSAGLACRAGCAACCHQRVSVLPAEADAIAAHLRRSDPARIDRLTERPRNAACPFLDDGRCSIYAVRPLRCRGLHSRDAAACRKWPEGRAATSAVGTFPHAPIALMDAALAGLGQALDEAGHGAATLDLAAAVAERLTADQAMELPAKSPIFPT
jgi:hypothetical protein